jgi:hypothetical protein
MDSGDPNRIMLAVDRNQNKEQRKGIPERTHVRAFLLIKGIKVSMKAHEKR